MTSASTAESVLALMQLSDSALPIGGYSHSWGLETWNQWGTICDATSAFNAIKTFLVQSIAPQDGIAVSIAHRAAQTGNLPLFHEINTCLTAGKWSKEPFLASTRMGSRLLKLATDTGMITDFCGLTPGGTECHHSAVYGWLTGCAGVDERLAVAGYLQNSVGCLVSACVRLVPLGHTDGQETIASLRPLVLEQAERCLNKQLSDMQSFLPLHEFACFEHESLYSRLFQS